MIIKEDDMKREDGYIIHWKTKGAKDGIRRFQSYAVAPTRSGMVGQEIGEAAKQRQRIENRNTPQGYKSNGGNKVYRDPQELHRQSQNNRNDDRRRPRNTPYGKPLKDKPFEGDPKELLRTFPRGNKIYRDSQELHRQSQNNRNVNIDTTKSKEHMAREIAYKTMRGEKPVKGKPFKEKLKEFNKKRWAKSYRKLYRHRDQYTVEELNNAMYRLGVEDTLKRKMGSLTVNTTKNGADIFKNLVSMAGSGLGMWNAYASAQNAYNTYKGNGKQMLPNALGKGTLTGFPKPKNKDNNDNDNKNKRKKGTAGHYDFEGPYLSHFGVKGMSWYHRYHQSYDTVPTRSGKVGVEHFSKSDIKTAKKNFKKALKLAYNGDTREMLTSRLTIPAGQKIYRSTFDKTQTTSGSTFVTLTKEDRNFYRGSDWTGITGEFKNAKKYETKYVLTEDLNVPSRKELQDAFTTVRKKNPTFLTSVLITYMKNGGYSELLNKKMRSLDLDPSIILNQKQFRDVLPEKIRKDLSNRIDEYTAYKDKLGNNSTFAKKEYKTAFNNKAELPKLMYQAIAMGKSEEIRKPVIDELKKKGFNAIVDEAGVAGKGPFAREGTLTMIVFDMDKSTKPLRTSEISKGMSKYYADNEYARRKRIRAKDTKPYDERDW